MISVVRAITTGSYRKNVVEFGFMKVSQNTSYMFLQCSAPCFTGCKGGNVIRPQGGFQLRNPNPDFLDFPFCRSIGKSEKGFAKLFSQTADYLVLIMPMHWHTQNGG